MRGRKILIAMTPWRGTMAWCTCAIEAAAIASEMPAEQFFGAAQFGVDRVERFGAREGRQAILQAAEILAAVTPIMSGRVARNWPTFT